MNQVEPVASGDRVAWTDVQPLSRGVEVMDMKTGIAELVTDAFGDQFNPDLDGDLIVWEDTRSGDSDIYIKDLVSGYEEVVAAGPAQQSDPAVAKNLVVWLEGGDIMLKNLDSGLVARLLADPHEKRSLAVTETGWVLWEDAHSGTPTLYGIDLEPARPELRLSVTHSFWDSYDDYQKRHISVEYRLSNQPTAPANSVEVIAVSATNTVVAETALPLVVGDIAPFDSRSFVIKYQLPEGVRSFITGLKVDCLDNALNRYMYP